MVFRDRDVRTACVALEMDSDAFEKLRRTQDLFRRACNLLVEIVCEDAERKRRLWQRYNLHHAGYYRVRETVPELGAQLTCNAIRAVSAAYQSILANNPKYTKDKKLALPKIVFKNIGIHLDARTLSFPKTTAVQRSLPVRSVCVFSCVPERFSRKSSVPANGVSASLSISEAKVKARAAGNCILLWSENLKYRISRISKRRKS